MWYSTSASLIILASLFAWVCPWTLHSTHQSIIPILTDDVTLNCFHDAGHSSLPVLKIINRIRVLKMDNASDTWTPLAEVTQPQMTTVNVFNQSESGIQVDGNLGDLSTTFLKVTWPRSTPGTVGRYICQIDGYRMGDGADSVIQSSVVDIANNLVTVPDLIKVILQMRHNIESSIVDNYFELRYWPSGNYGLLAPETGCPDTTSSSLVAGSGTFQTETHKAHKHTFSNPSHLGNNITERCGSRNIFRLNICSSRRSEPRLIWPKGSYCLNYITTCPPGFTPGHVKLFPETTVTTIVTETNTGDILGVAGSGSNSFVNIHFCCRSDGDVDEAIRLPALKPFYLYRHKGKCQKVFNMDVSDEWFEIDTNDAKTDVYLNVVNHPDGKLNDARIQLCYYTKRVE